MDFFCKDCKYYLPVDVFKGICKISKEKILPDNHECKKIVKQMKCKFCTNYSNDEDKEFLGKCMNLFDSYPDMIAKYCKDFTWK